MDDGLNGDFNVVYDGSSNPMLLEYQVSKLISARSYRFIAQAVDKNGPGFESAISTFIACLRPTDINSPLLESVSKTSFTISWLPP